MHRMVLKELGYTDVNIRIKHCFRLSLIIRNEKDKMTQKNAFWSNEWPWPDDIHANLTRIPWRYSECAKMNFLCQGFQKLSSDIHT